VISAGCGSIGFATIRGRSRWPGLKSLGSITPALTGGVGRALIEAVYAEADAAGCPAVYWLTQDLNAPARRLYDRVAHVTPFI